MLSGLFFNSIYKYQDKTIFKNFLGGGFVGITVLIIIIFVMAFSDDFSSGSSYRGSGSHTGGSSFGGGSLYGGSNRWSNRECEFEEADSFYDHNGDEHIVDYDGYCEDCDDYHDDY